MKKSHIALLAILAAGAVAILILALRQSTPPKTDSSSGGGMPAASPGITHQSSHTKTESVSKPNASPTPAMEEIPAWENQIDQVLRSNVTETQTAQILLNMLPTLPEDGQIEAANHVANLLPDENYTAAKPILLNPSFPESVLSVLFSDLMNRGDTVKLRAFLDIAKIPNHPFHEDALNDLEIYIGDNYGTDWTKWNAAVEKYLKESETQ